MTTNYIGYTGYVQGPRLPGTEEVYATLKGSPTKACLIAAIK